MTSILFYVFSLLALAAALGVLLQKKAMNAALCLVACLTSVGAIYLLLGAQFMGLLQLIVYAGAIMVLFVVVIMLLDPYSDKGLRSQNSGWGFFAVLMGTGLLAVSGWAILHYRTPLSQAAPPPVAPGGNVQQLATILFRDWLLPFESVSILILVAIVGAVLLARRHAS